MILRWCHINSGALYMMVPLDWYGNVVYMVLLLFLVCWRWGPHSVPDPQEDSS
jgi:hypothetical protein